MKLKGLFLIFIICFFAYGLILPASADDKNPKLILQITVDQLRGDLPMRFKERLGAEVPKEANLIHQERAYTSPIWYTP